MRIFVFVHKNTRFLFMDRLILIGMTEKWGRPAPLRCETVPIGDGVAEVRVQVTDENGTYCLDGADFFCFSIAGDGERIDNQGTVSGSRMVQARNGRGQIRVRTNGGKSCVGIRYKGVETAFVNL